MDVIALHYSKRNLHILAQMIRERQAIILDYRFDSAPRYGYGRPLHSKLEGIIEKNKDQYKATLQSFLKFKENFLVVPPYQDPTQTTTLPCWHNNFVPGLDAVALYSFLVQHKPKRYFEIGSGNSTRWAKKAITEHNLPTKVTAIDPEPRAEISQICDTLIRKRIEDVDLGIFDQLEENDILFVDSSHCCFMNSDVTVEFLEILPRLKSGVFLEFHDITLPFDYPHDYIERWYSEQYLLAVYLLSSRNYEVVLPNWYVSHTPGYDHILRDLWENPALAGVERHGCSFWIKIT